MLTSGATTKRQDSAAPPHTMGLSQHPAPTIWGSGPERKTAWEVMQLHVRGC